jgi:hypothetical protein
MTLLGIGIGNPWRLTYGWRVGRVGLAVLLLAFACGCDARDHALGARTKRDARLGSAVAVQLSLGRQARCPVLSVPPLYGQHDEVVAAARRLMIHGSVSAQGETTKLTRNNSPVLAVTVLAETALPIPGAAKLRAEAARRCGAETARASWAVTISVPALMSDAAMRTSFLVKTKTGWRIY